MTFAIRGVRGKEYQSVSSHDRFRETTVQASLSGTVDTNRSSFLLNLVAYRSIWHVCHFPYQGHEVSYHTLSLF